MPLLDLPATSSLNFRTASMSSCGVAFTPIHAPCFASSKLGTAFLPRAAAARAEEARQRSPQEQAMMEKYMKAATPGPEHQAMAKMAGKWNLKVTAWMAPGAPPQTSNGTAEFRSILG